ncbi:bifunctional DNA primase/polymerase [Streptomyces sp. 5.8]|uniref:bifunctional DNA primase/polymerase n=1 Tax=Streptomyces sp. 5.8 TaxID=3406571 RepID=UPI003BB4E08E
MHRCWSGREFGVGVATGPSGLVVLDLDDHDRPPPDQALLLPGIDLTQHPDTDLGQVRTGADVLGLLCRVRRAGSLLDTPATLTVQTPSGGRAGTCRARGGSAGRSTYGASWSTAVAPGTPAAAGHCRIAGNQDSPVRLPRWGALELEHVGLGHHNAAAGPPCRGRLPRPTRERGLRDDTAYAAAALRGDSWRWHRPAPAATTTSTAPGSGSVSWSGPSC